MTEDDKTPTISKELLAYLESVLPKKDWLPIDSHDEILFYSGKRALINFLKELHLEQLK